MSFFGSIKVDELLDNLRNSASHEDSTPLSYLQFLELTRNYFAVSGTLDMTGN